MEFSFLVNDTVGDVEAAKYGGAEKGRVPRFRRIGGESVSCSWEKYRLVLTLYSPDGRVIGLDNGLRITPGSSSREVEITPGGRKV
jgi:hypothetical protein